MGQTITEKIIARHAGLGRVSPGDFVDVAVDQTWSDDLGSPLTLGLLKEHGIRHVHDRETVFVTSMVNAPAQTVANAEVLKIIRNLTGEYSIPLYEMGKAAIHNSLGIELGKCLPGELIVGGNSHACMAGGIGAFATGMGSTDIAAILATGRTWLEVPHTLRFRFTGTAGRWITGKDLMLKVISIIGFSGADSAAVEFRGDPIHALEQEERFAMTNMAIECGATNAIIEPDEKTFAYVKDIARRPFEAVYGDADAKVAREYTIDVTGMEPIVAVPYLPSNGKPLSEVRGTRMDQVYIGSCTNGWIHDLRVAASILEGRKVKDGLRVIVIPSTAQIHRQAVQEGLAQIFLEAGCAFSMPTCGPCIGAHMGVLAEGEVCLSTSNRNFPGRQGHVKSQTYLCSPAVAAASAIKGLICGPDDL
ncbi:MAG TPA: aconitase/3-isopropylmalate dehydratase large subunit family protein [Ramlibacter sp.]|nr:aconitase/3-isopropylmalate dehydratase large subunit family protein [Ramlibacter sp.]